MNAPERVSLELTRRCKKACMFCYNASDPAAGEEWRAGDVVELATALVPAGLRALSLGGGEPLEYDGLEEVFAGLEPLRRGTPSLFVSMTTNGLLLDAQMERVSELNPDKIHVSVHFPSRERELSRVVRQVLALRSIGLLSGVNLLVRKSELDASTHAREELWRHGIDNRSIVYLPMRGEDTPSPKELADVAGGPFQTMTCINQCAPSPRFVSIGADKTIAHCSYTQTRRRLTSLDVAGLHEAMSDLGLAFCGDEVPTMVAQQKRRLALV